jgi:hypothetical protein
VRISLDEMLFVAAIALVVCVILDFAGGHYGR